ncbi:MAG: allophanate hydrolase subunit 2 family protein, partial [Polyangiaceae bacterium]
RKGDRVGVGVDGGVGVGVGVEGGVGVGVGVEAPIGIVVGPDERRFAPEALRALLGEGFTLSPASDRTGTRLFGPRLAVDSEDSVSTPMVAGAVQVPGAGDPIVLGPDHPTTGGYPVLAVIVRADLGRFHARPIGSTVHFTRADPRALTRV